MKSSSPNVALFPNIEAGRARRSSIRPRLVRWTHVALASLLPRPQRYELTSPDTAGLQIRVEPNGRRVFLYRYRWRGKTTRLTLGEFGAPPLLGLAEARTLAAEARALLARGMNPATARPTAAPVRAVTRGPRVSAVRVEPHGPRTGHAADPSSVASLVDEFVRIHVRTHAKDPEPTVRLLEREVVSHFGDRDARSISPREIVLRLDEIVARGAPYMANKTAALLSQLFRFGIQRGLVEHSPVLLLGKPGGRQRPRSRVLSEEEVQTFLQHLDEVYRSERTKQALRVLLYTGQRRGELFRAEWRDVDLAGREWTIRETVAKNGQRSIVPLSDAAIAAFEKLEALARGSRFVMPTDDGRAMADPKPLTRAVARSLKNWRALGIDEQFNVHDLRRTLRTGLARLRVPPHIAERVIGHKQRGILAVYDLHAYTDEKREALERWATYLAGLEARPKKPRKAGAPVLEPVD
jgi:integrase